MDRYSNTPEEEKDLAQTPKWFFDAVQKVLRLKFDLDVCAIADTAKCGVYYSVVENGQDALKLDWEKSNFCNPPYSDIKPWIKKAGIEALKGNTSVLLIPDKPETEYTRLVRCLADSVFHMPFRLQFLRPDGQPFLDSKGNKQGPKFAVACFLFTPWGVALPVRDQYIDFRKIGTK